MYFNTNGEAYQVFNCNVETHEDSGPEVELRIMYELATYENYLGRETATVCYIHNQMVYACIIWLCIRISITTNG